MRISITLELVDRENATPHSDFIRTYVFTPSFQMVLMVKNLPAMQEKQKIQVPSLGGEDPLEEGVATHSSVLAWSIPWTEEPGGLQAMGSPRVRHDWSVPACSTQADLQRCLNSHRWTWQSQDSNKGRTGLRICPLVNWPARDQSWQISEVGFDLWSRTGVFHSLLGLHSLMEKLRVMSSISFC